MMAKGVVDAAGPDVLRRLWDAFARRTTQLAGVLGDQVHPAAGQWLDIMGRSSPGHDADKVRRKA